MITTNIWRTIQIGTHSSVNSLISDISWRGIDGSENIPRDITLASQPHSLNLVCEKMEKHGFWDEKLFIDHMLKNGHTLCPAEVGPQLRRQWRVQSENSPISFLRIVMNPIYFEDPEHRYAPRRFDLGNIGLYTKGYYGKPTIGFFPDSHISHWVFVKT